VRALQAAERRCVLERGRGEGFGTPHPREGGWRQTQGRDGEVRRSRLPTIKFFDPDGNEVGQLGTRDPASVKNKLEAVAAQFGKRG
jgi:hypothetical protein